MKNLLNTFNTSLNVYLLGKVHVYNILYIFIIIFHIIA